MAELNEGFDTPITVSGPLPSPAQLLGDQSYDGHASATMATPQRQWG